MQNPILITGPSAWIGDEIRLREAWQLTLTPAELDEVVHALNLTSALSMSEITKHEFKLPTLVPRLH